jgi:hypothetical protein
MWPGISGSGPGYTRQDGWLANVKKSGIVKTPGMTGLGGRSYRPRNTRASFCREGRGRGQCGRKERLGTRCVAMQESTGQGQVCADHAEQAREGIERREMRGSARDLVGKVKARAVVCACKAQSVSEAGEAHSRERLEACARG